MAYLRDYLAPRPQLWEERLSASALLAHHVDELGERLVALESENAPHSLSPEARLAAIFGNAQTHAILRDQNPLSARSSLPSVSTLM